MCFGCDLRHVSTLLWLRVWNAHRELYNAALQERRDAWAHSKTRIYYGDQSAQLTDDPGGATGYRRVVIFQSAGHAAPVEQGVRRVLPAGQNRQAGRQARISAFQRQRHGFTVWSGPETETALAGYPRPSGCICKASARSRSTSTAKWPAG